MIRLAAEVWAILACCFLVGGLVGWLLSRVLRPLLGGLAASARRSSDEEDSADTIVPLPATVPVVLPPVSRREPAIATIDVVPVSAPGAAAQRPNPRPGRIRPPALAGPRQGRADPLTRIAGLSRRHADRLYAVGVYHFSQIAAWTPQELDWVRNYLDLGDGATAEDWPGQAARFAVTEGPRRPPRT